MSASASATATSTMLSKYDAYQLQGNWTYSQGSTLLPLPLLPLPKPTPQLLITSMTNNSPTNPLYLTQFSDNKGTVYDFVNAPRPPSFAIPNNQTSTKTYAIIPANSTVANYLYYAFLNPAQTKTGTPTLTITPFTNASTFEAFAQAPTK